jgi:hypothetical protein
MFVMCGSLFAGHWARVPPDPVPNSEVKPCSVPRCIAVFGREKPGKLATPQLFFKSNKFSMALGE